MAVEGVTEWKVHLELEFHESSDESCCDECGLRVELLDVQQDPSSHEEKLIKSTKKYHEISTQTEISCRDIGIQYDVDCRSHSQEHSKVYQCDSEELNSELLHHYGSEKGVEKEIKKRKLVLEYNAEKAARARQAQWVRDRISLEQAIDNLFSEQILLHEKAHALRLHFEREKLMWTKAVENHLQTWRNFRPPEQQESSSYSTQNGNEHPPDNSLHVPTLRSPILDDEFQYYQVEDTPDVNATSHPNSRSISPEPTYHRLPSTRKYRSPSKEYFN